MQLHEKQLVLEKEMQPQKLQQEKVRRQVVDVVQLQKEVQLEDQHEEEQQQKGDPLAEEQREDDNPPLFF